MRRPGINFRISRDETPDKSLYISGAAPMVDQLRLSEPSGGTKWRHYDVNLMRRGFLPDLAQNLCVTDEAESVQLFPAFNPCGVAYGEYGSASPGPNLWFIDDL